MITPIVSDKGQFLFPKETKDSFITSDGLLISFNFVTLVNVFLNLSPTLYFNFLERIEK